MVIHKASITIEFIVSGQPIRCPKFQKFNDIVFLQKIFFRNDPACGDRGEDVVAVSADLLAALTGYGEVGDVAALEIVVGVGEQSLIDVGHDLAVAGFVVVVDEYPP